MNNINPSTNNPVSCVNCQAITTNDGRTVWVCEQCGTENTVTAAPDVLDAQTAISDAAAAAETPAVDVTMPVSPPVYTPAEEPVVQPEAPVAPAPATPAAPYTTSAVQVVKPDI